MTVTASSENRFKIEFNEKKILNNSILSGNLPDLNVESIIIPHSGNNIKVTGDTLDIGDITLTLKLDEDYENYNLIYEWLINNKLYGNDPDNIVFDTIEYFILGANYIPLMSFTLGYVFPTNLSEIPHTSQSITGDELEFTVTFKINTIRKNTSI